MRRSVVVITRGLCVAITSCSFHSAVRTRDHTVACMESVAPAVGDLVPVFGATMMALLAITCSNDVAEQCNSREIGTIALAETALPFLASAIYGFTRPRCDETLDTQSPSPATAANPAQLVYASCTSGAHGTCFCSPTLAECQEARQLAAMHGERDDACRALPAPDCFARSIVPVDGGVQVDLIDGGGMP